MTAEQVRAARAAYREIRERRLTHIRAVSDEASAPVSWADRAELERLERQELAARQAWLALAPDEPTAWWPGGWRVRLATGTIHRRGGVAGLGVWPTRQAAEDYVRAQTAWYDLETASAETAVPVLWQASVEWCAVRDDPRRVDRLEVPVVALDAEGWIEIELNALRPT